MKLLSAIFLFTFLYLFIAPSVAISGDMPSCYTANKLDQYMPVPEREVFVLVDQTTYLDENLRESLRDNFVRLIQPGTAFVIADFSAFSQGRYMEIVNSGIVESKFPANVRGSISVKLLQKFDACLKDQMGYGIKLAVSSVNKSVENNSSTLAKSDVMASIKDLSSRVKLSRAKEKIVIIASDMLENSSISSFYASKNVKKIVPVQELKLAKENEMFGDFTGARVFVLGAGIVPEDQKKGSKAVYRDPKTMRALKQFWQGYFDQSHAKLVEFGLPALLNPIK